MKKVFIIVLLFLGSFGVQAQELKWETDINKAIAVSNKTKKPMLLFFTGSDWCVWCIRLQKEVLKTPEFKTWAVKNVVLVELDYPRGKPQSDKIKNQNAGLQETFGIQGFPTLYFATAKLNKKKQPSYTGIGSMGYVAGGPKAWLAEADEILKRQ
ncbi:MAG TPA: thioredoxin family protein [Flavobacterium sp.]|nr:thioredoxin family protein [Flavobacterium sp.]HAT75809.1 thioredoxin family protein [Flavobacterium sp.]HAT81123.1 thioredoxin family protein [Flavobacterium sp.]